MRRRLGAALMLLGLIMILSAAALLFHNRSEETAAAQSAGTALKSMQELIPSPSPPAVTALPEELREFPVLPVKDIEGYGYIGYLSIPALELELPVMADWDYARLQKAPCREKGDTARQLIIAGHNYERHFGQLKNLSGGELISFTDMEGRVNEYEVRSVETIGPGDRDRVEDEKLNLVLYTCTYGGQQRVMVGCVLI